ncbi:MAG: aldehyde ferredoxin oxidoreductase N-terminal domain-containing protein, partial [Promethearchaeota archaeon]
MNSGNFGKVLWVDLTNEKFEEQDLPNNTYLQYFGGYGLGCKLIYENMSPKVDALSSDSIFGFFPGLLTGTVAPFSGRYMVAGKSPLTGTWGDANSGGTFGPEIKKCGFDAILFKGIADSPKYVALIDDNKDILDAADLWGLDIINAEKYLRKKHGKFIKTAGIGRAGEKLSHISGIANDKGRIAARSGIGAIMGSKNLKMLVLKGAYKVPLYDKDSFMSLVKMYNQEGKKKEPGKLIRSILRKAPNFAKLMRRFKIQLSGPAGMIRHIYHNYG